MSEEIRNLLAETEVGSGQWQVQGQVHRPRPALSKGTADAIKALLPSGPGKIKEAGEVTQPLPEKTGDPRPDPIQPITQPDMTHDP
jgi:hypothetical protein